MREVVATILGGRLRNVNAPAPPTAAPDARTDGLRGVLAGLRIVIVDDDADAREMLATLLTQRTAEVFAGESAAEAFDLLLRERPDVLVSDIAMPEEDGYMLIRRVRALSADEGGRIPALAVTAYAGRADRTRALEAGFDGHFAKPIDIDSLVERLVEIRSAREARST
jgi:CheY-like chemotaxis protein